MNMEKVHVRYSIAILLTCLILFVGSCSDTEEENVSEEYFGTFYASTGDYTFIEAPSETTDSVILIIRNKREYTLFFSKLIPTSNEKTFCSSSGQIEGFGSNTVTFFPSTVDTGDCGDRIRYPCGPFVGDFVTRGDTIYLEKMPATRECVEQPMWKQRFILLQN